MSTSTRTEDAGLAASLNLQRKAAITRGGPVDHAGQVQVTRMDDFDMDRTIFGGLEGIARKFMDEKLAKEASWDDDAASAVEAAYAEAESRQPAPPIDQRLIDFMMDECDFSMEHADGSFLDHLVFCHNYAARHYSDLVEHCSPALDSGHCNEHICHEGGQDSQAQGATYGLRGAAC
ncbi:MAG: hypothetical protein HKN91_04740 [Acidimicrobiia bacterium]|nr:hypothetical protein [Acidimicrobiia bacterium]